MSQLEMSKLQAEKPDQGARFNMRMKYTQQSIVVVGLSSNLTVEVQVPVLENMVAVRQGEQLYVRVEGKEAKAPKKKSLTWKDEAAVAAKQKAKALPKQPGRLQRSKLVVPSSLEI